MHKIFGEKENVQYAHRKGAYLLPVRDGKIAVIQTEKGYFFLGGGMEPGETDEECIRRECLEECGWEAAVGETLCAAEAYMLHPEIGYFHPIQTYYSGVLLRRVGEPPEAGHTLCWLEPEALRSRMFAPMQNWALERLAEGSGKDE